MAANYSLWNSTHTQTLEEEIGALWLPTIVSGIVHTHTDFRGRNRSIVAANYIVSGIVHTQTLEEEI